jgi:hypothetical protein
MGRYGVKRMGRGGDLLQDLILLNLLPQEADVISQAADLGSDFIDQRQSHVGLAAVGGRSVHADAVVAEYLTIHALFEFSDEAGAVQFFQKVGVGLVRQIEEDGDARRIPAPDFEPVDAVEHGVDLSEDGDAPVGCRVVTGGGQGLDPANVAGQFHIQTPDHVLDGSMHVEMTSTAGVSRLPAWSTSSVCSRCRIADNRTDNRQAYSGRPGH